MKIACMGDSITYGEGLADRKKRWTDLTEEKTGHTLVNFGISGDTTTGMIARCQKDVFGQGFDALLWLGGVNDISYTSDYRTAWANTLAVYCQAKAYGIPFIMGIPLPVTVMPDRAYYPHRSGEQVMALVEEYAAVLKIYCEEKGIPYADFRAAFLGEDGRGREELFLDGLHPNEQGHALMAEALCKTLSERF